jgi:hypothetical protein
MATKEEFIKRQHDEVRETLGKLHAHQEDIAERLASAPDDEKLKALLGEAELGVRALEPVFDEFERDDVEPHEMVDFTSTIDEWQEKEREISENLK